MWELLIPGLNSEFRWVAATRARLVAIRGGHFLAIGSCRPRAHVEVFPPKEQGKEDQKQQYVRRETLTCKNKKRVQKNAEPVPISASHLHVNK